MYTVTFQNRHTGMHHVAGHEETEKKAMRLAKVFLADKRLSQDVRVYRGQAGEELIFSRGVA